MAFTTTLSSSLTEDAQFTIENDLTGKLSTLLVQQGFSVISDVQPGTERIIVLKCPYTNYCLSMNVDAYYGNQKYMWFQVIASDGVSILVNTNTPYNSTLQGGMLKVLSGTNSLVISVTTNTVANFTMAFLKFSDGNWYCWVNTSGACGCVLDNVSGIVYSIGTLPSYPPFLNGSYPMMPVLIQSSNNTWNVYPLSVYSILPTIFSNNLFSMRLV